MRTPFALAAALFAATSAAVPCFGAATPPSEVEQLQASLQTIQKAMTDLTAQLASTQARLAELEKARAAGAPATPVMSTDVLPTELTNVRDHQSFTGDQAAAPRAYNYPLEPGLDGFMPVFNTRTVIKLGGYIRVDAITDDGNNGNPNQWVPSSFPIGTDEDSEGQRSQIHAKGSRLNLELRRPAGTSDRLRVYYENDFFNSSSSSSMDYRLRHLYGQAFNLLVGHTYSTFQDIDAWPDTIDGEGPNGMVSKRQAQVRWTIPAENKKSSFAMALEQPGYELTSAGLPPGAAGVNRWPDATAAWRWEDKAVGHAQLSGVLRELRYEQPGSDGSNALGWGLSLSGAFTTFGNDKVYGQIAYGEGVSHYFNDTSGLGLDASLDANNDFTAIPTTAWVVGYTHMWNDAWRSNASYGWIELDPDARLGGNTFDHTQYGSLNLIWQPAKSLRVGLEALYGQKVVLSGAEAEGFRFNFVFKYDIVK